MSSAGSFTVQMKEILEECSRETEETYKKGAQTTAKEAAQKLKSSSPRKTGDYSSGWAVRKVDDKTFVVYNKTAPGLTHLLENGHAIVNKKGEYGRVSGKKHIKPVEEWAIDELQRKIEAKL